MISRNDLLQMKPGSDLDAMVAEHVMEQAGTDAPYSTDFQSAWQVVEKMRERHLMFYATYHPEWELYLAGFWKKGECFDYKFAHADQLPEAIVKAALLAVFRGEEGEPPAKEADEKEEQVARG